MKKLLLAFALVGSSMLASAQMDIGVTEVTLYNLNTLNTYPANSSIEQGDTVLVGFTFTNFGDSLVLGDTINFLDETDGFAPLTVSWIVDSALANGQTLTLVEPLSFAFTTTNIPTGAWNICVTSQMQGDANAANDQTCIAFTIISAASVGEIVEPVSELYYAQGLLHYQLNTAQQADIAVYNLAGQQVLADKLFGAGNTVDMNTLPNGYYVVAIRMEGQTVTRKIAKF